MRATLSQVAEGYEHSTIAALENSARRLRPDRTVMDAPQNTRHVHGESGIGHCLGTFEREQSEFFQRVRAEYLRIAQADPKRVKVIDASQNRGQVEKAVRACIETVIREMRA